MQLFPALNTMALLDRDNASSDSEPEDVSFKQARETALDDIQRAAKAVQDKKQRRKEAIQRKQEAVAEQKRRKLERLKEQEDKKLPADFLDGLEDDVGGVGEQAEVGPSAVMKLNNKRTTFTEEGDLEDCRDQTAGSESEFIALETKGTDFYVLSRKDLGKKSFRSAKAEDFRQSMLYGGRVKRMSNKELTRRREKLKVSGKSRLVTS